MAGAGSCLWRIFTEAEMSCDGSAMEIPVDAFDSNAVVRSVLSSPTITRLVSGSMART